MFCKLSCESGDRFLIAEASLTRVSPSSDDPNCQSRENPYGGDGSLCKILVNHKEANSGFNCTLAGDIPQEPVGFVEPLIALPGEPEL